MNRHLTFLALILALYWPICQADLIDDQREQFLAAEAALTQGDMPRFETLSAQLQDYPLYPYLRYAALKDNLNGARPAPVDDFLDRYADTPLARQLRLKWLDQLAREARWAQYRDYYRPLGSTRRQCVYLQALLNTGDKAGALAQVEPLWLHGSSQPTQCDRVFDAWRKAGLLTTDLVWQRIALAMQQGNSGLARYLGRYLPKAERPWLALWRDLYRHPDRLLSSQQLDSHHPYRDQMIHHAIKRRAHRDGLQALVLWQRARSRFDLDPLIVHAIERDLTFALTREEDPRAYRFILSLDPCSHDRRLQESRLKAALYRQDWPRVLQWIARLPRALQEEESWRYWRARALEQTGARDEAEKQFARLAQERSYHGFLAADRSGLAYALNHQDTTPHPIDSDALRNEPAVQRAHELYLLDRSLAARREWYRLTLDLAQDKLMAAAKLAESWGWRDQAIFTLARSKFWEDLKLRFPLDHNGLVNRYAERQSLAPAYVFAVIRQESAFRADAHSPAGARGLMQLMPATARRVAKQRLQQKPPTRRQLKQPATNIALGTAYLRQVLDKWQNNPVLATASYNAGPHRVMKWLPSDQLPADIWVELIPFRETRGYVKHVLTYQVIYEKRLGLEPERLSSVMQDIHNEDTYVLGRQRQADAG